MEESYSRSRLKITAFTSRYFHIGEMEFDTWYTLIMNPTEKTFHNPTTSPEKTHGEIKHEGWNTSTETLQKILVKVSDSPITESHKITLGESNEVFSVTTEDNTEYIVRIFHGEDTKFEKEQWAIEECKKVGIPVPEVFLVDSLVVDSKPLQISVLSKLPGVPLNQIPNITTPEAQAELIALLHQVGEVLAKIHSIEMHGYGRIDKEHRGQHETIEDLLREVKAYLDNIITPALLNRPEDLEAVKRAFEILKRKSTNLQTSSPRLIHNDFAPDHILINDEGMISGIIDFESANAADPLVELAHWDDKYGKSYPLKYVLEGYGNATMTSKEGFGEKLSLWKIYRSFASLRHCVRENNIKGVDRALQRIKDAAAVIQED